MITLFIVQSIVPLFDPFHHPMLIQSMVENYLLNSSKRIGPVRFYNVCGNNGFNKFDDAYSHLIRKAAAVANGKFDTLEIFGTDYDTRDGTCIRNYTHVVDIVDSLHKVVENKPTGVIESRAYCWIIQRV